MKPLLCLIIGGYVGRATKTQGFIYPLSRSMIMHHTTNIVYGISKASVRMTVYVIVKEQTAASVHITQFVCAFVRDRVTHAGNGSHREARRTELGGMRARLCECIRSAVHQCI